MSGQSNIAIVVPVRGDTQELYALIDRIHSWSEQPKEIVVVSAASDPELSAFCAANDCRYLESEPCRGVQLDSGARSAEAPVLWFLHADAVPYPSSLDPRGPWMPWGPTSPWRIGNSCSQDPA